MSVVVASNSSFPSLSLSLSEQDSKISPSQWHTLIRLSQVGSLWCVCVELSLLLTVKIVRIVCANRKHGIYKERDREREENEKGRENEKIADKRKKKEPPNEKNITFYYYWFLLLAFVKEEKGRENEKIADKKNQKKNRRTTDSNRVQRLLTSNYKLI